MEAATFLDRVWAAVRDKYRSEVSGGEEGVWSCPSPRPAAPHKGAASSPGTGPPWPAGRPRHPPQRPPSPQLSVPSLKAPWMGQRARGPPRVMVGAWTWAPRRGGRTSESTAPTTLPPPARCCPLSRPRPLRLTPRSPGRSSPQRRPHPQRRTTRTRTRTRTRQRRRRRRRRRRTPRCGAAARGVGSRGAGAGQAAHWPTPLPGGPAPPGAPAARSQPRRGQDTPL